MQNALKIAEEKGIRKIAFPPMGTGFYGIPLEVSARLMLEVITAHLAEKTSLEEVVICVLDNQEYRAFQAGWEANNAN